MKTASFISVLLKIFSLAFPDISFPIFSISYFSLSEKTDRVIILALTGNPCIDLTVQIIRKSKFELDGPMDSYTIHPWSNKVLLNNLLRSEGETKNTTKDANPFSLFAGLLRRGIQKLLNFGNFT